MHDGERHVEATETVPLGHAEKVQLGHAPKVASRDGFSFILGLQRTAGNTAVGRLLRSRSPTAVAACPSGPHSPTRVLARWDSPEHVQLGETAAGPVAPLIRLTSHARDLSSGYTGGTTWPAGWHMLTLAPTTDQVRAMTGGLTYGEVIALSGDMYRSWEDMNAAPLREVIDLIPLIRSGATTTQLQNATAGRYLALAAVNVSHFSNVPTGVRNVDVWRSLHARAINAGIGGHSNEAWGINACADHFLTDAFSGGHIRTPRAQLAAGGALGNIESKILHDLDNENGVQVTNARGDPTWIAYGDDMINDPRNLTNKNLATEAVRLSRQDITDALAQRITGVSASFAAERLIPTPVDPSVDRWTGRTPTYVQGPNGEMVRVEDDYTQMRARVIRREGPGVVAGFFDDDNQVRDWVSRMDTASLARQPVAEKLRMINTLIGGFFSWITDADMVAMEKILGSVQSVAEMQTLRNALEPRALDFSDLGQRTRFRVALIRDP